MISPVSIRLSRSEKLFFFIGKELRKQKKR